MRRCLRAEEWASAIWAREATMASEAHMSLAHRAEAMPVPDQDLTETVAAMAAVGTRMTTRMIWANVAEDVDSHSPGEAGDRLPLIKIL